MNKIRKPFLEESMTRASRLKSGMLDWDNSRALVAYRAAVLEDLTKLQDSVPEIRSGVTRLEEMLDLQKAKEATNKINRLNREIKDRPRHARKALWDARQEGKGNVPYLVNRLVQLRRVHDTYSPLYDQLVTAQKEGKDSEQLQKFIAEADKRVSLSRVETLWLCIHYGERSREIENIHFAAPNSTEEEKIRRVLAAKSMMLYLLGNPSQEPETFQPDIAWYHAIGIGKLLTRNVVFGEEERLKLGVEWFTGEDLESLDRFDVTIKGAATSLSKELMSVQRRYAHSLPESIENTVHQYETRLNQVIPGAGIYQGLHVQNPQRVNEHLDRMLADPAGHGTAAFVASLHYALHRFQSNRSVVDSLYELSRVLPFHDEDFRKEVGRYGNMLAERERLAEGIHGTSDPGRSDTLREIKDFSNIPEILVPVFAGRVDRAITRGQYR